ncbi:MAG TPA: polyprenyl synthetase family protein [Verrucomicrobiota bacterium]|jgi:octaprenyl-diphosphate synthase|nr:polyprenyl synthetase family protein [Verrucomicrobiota bacterium]
MFAVDSKAVCAPTAAVFQAELPGDWKQIIRPVEPFLAAVGQRLTQQVAAFDSHLSGYAHYALNGQGKHLRAALVALTGRALGKVTDDHVTVAAIIELVHLATLVHDDVIDEAEMRRGQPTLAAHWDNERAVLFGDCLFAHALKLAADFPTPEICRAVASATNTVCSGELLQIQHRRDFRLGRAGYFKVLEMKTAELFALACELSARLSGVGGEPQAALRRFGLALGTAYQVYDDCVDLFGSETPAGKDLGRDLAKGKLTLPVLLVWERANAADRKLLQGLVEAWQAGAIDRLAALLARYQAFPASLEVFHQYLETARQALQVLPAATPRDSLLALADYLRQQAEGLRPAPARGL